MSISRFGIVGAGQMGRGIAQVAAQAGIDVVLLDASKVLADAGKERIERSLGRQVDKGKVDASQKDEILARIRTTESYDEFSDSDIVVEAATENFAVKTKIFEAVDEAMGPQGILASNTSSISLTKLAGLTGRPDRVIGMHFMNPVPVMKLVEIVRAMQTSEETYDVTRALSERMGKTTITAQDRPGFVVNRMLIPFLNEACFALSDGVATPEDIDAGATLGLNHPLGPLALADLIGLDTVLSIAEVLHTEFGDDKYRPPALLRNYVAAGWLGRKSGRGFFTYEKR